MRGDFYVDKGMKECAACFFGSLVLAKKEGGR
jgi:hypothetical protein